jgi:hypothetical protein
MKTFTLEDKDAARLVEILGSLDTNAYPGSYHLWLEIDEQVFRPKPPEITEQWAVIRRFPDDLILIDYEAKHADDAKRVRDLIASPADDGYASQYRVASRLTSPWKDA